MDSETLKEKLQDAKETLQEKAQEAVETVKEVAADTVEGAKDVAADAKEIATDVAEKAQEVTADVVEKAQDVAEEAKEKVQDVAEEVQVVAEEVVEDTKQELKELKEGPAEPKAAAPAGPTKKLPTDRNLIKFIVFSICTIGIYALVQLTKISSEVNTVCKPHDQKSTMSFIIAWLLAFITCGIVPLVWYHKICDRIGMELMRRHLPYSLSSGTFWGWCILGSCIFIGPYVFLHKFLKAMNTLNADYNEKG